MKKFISQLKNKLTGSYDEDVVDDMPESGDEYLELNSEPSKDSSSKVVVRPFTLDDFEDVKEILESLREGYTIALVNIRPLRDKDIIELKRAINKIKKTCDAIQGDIAGFGDDWIVVAPSFAEIYRSSQTAVIDD